VPFTGIYSYTSVPAFLSLNDSVTNGEAITHFLRPLPRTYSVRCAAGRVRLSFLFTCIANNSPHLTVLLGTAGAYCNIVLRIPRTQTSSSASEHECINVEDRAGVFQHLELEERSPRSSLPLDSRTAYVLLLDTMRYRSAAVSTNVIGNPHGILSC
jgi:hypothetical protein